MPATHGSATFPASAAPTATGGRPAPLTIADTGELRDRVVLVATDGSPPASAAARVAATLARTRGARPVAVRAFDPAPLVVPGGLPRGAPASETLLGYDALEMTARALRADLAQTVPDSEGWPAHVKPGTPVEVITTMAGATAAALIAMGLRPRTALQRTVRDEYALRVLRNTEVPVLAATAELPDAPQRIVVGVDFCRAGLRAGRAALALLGDRGTLVLAYVQPPHPAAREDTEGEASIHADGVSAGFARTREKLAAPKGVRIETAVLEGWAGARLAEFAERVGADAIAVGSRRHDFVDRLLLGSVTAHLAHKARCSLLIVPPPAPVP